MPGDGICDHSQFELSVAHDEARKPSVEVTGHATTCDECKTFERNLPRLDHLLRRGETGGAPEIWQPAVAAGLGGRSEWWAVAAVVVAGLMVGAVMAGAGRLDIVQAQDLRDRFHTASPSVVGLSARLVIVERGWHPRMAERLYVGVIGVLGPREPGHRPRRHQRLPRPRVDTKRPLSPYRRRRHGGAGISKMPDRCSPSVPATPGGSRRPRPAAV